MKTLRSSFALLTAAIVLSSAGITFGGDVYSGNGLRIESPWARATVASARTGAVYMTLTNTGTEVDRLIVIETPVATRAHIHETVIDGNVMKMRPINDLSLKPGEPIAMAPGGMHIMLMKLTEPLRQGGSFPLTMQFEKAGTVTLNVVIGGLGQMDPPK